MIFTLLTLNHGTQPTDKFLIAAPFSMYCKLIIHSFHSCVNIFSSATSHAVQGAHLNEYFFFFSCSGLLYIHMLMSVSELSKTGPSCLFSAGAFKHQVPHFTTHERHIHCVIHFLTFCCFLLVLRFSTGDPQAPFSASTFCKQIL